MASTLLLMLSLSLGQAPAEKPQKVEVIRGGVKKKAPAGSAASQSAEALAAKERELAKKSAELDAKNHDLDARSQDLDARAKEVESGEAALKAEKEKEKEKDKKRTAEQKALDNYTRETNATVETMGNALSGQ